MKPVHFILAATACLVISCTSMNNRKAGTSDIENNATPGSPAAKKGGPLGTPQFETTTYDFKKITDGEIVQHKFKFKNIGKGDITISNVTASCGCTTPEWTKELVPPGGEGYVLATFNSSGKGDKNGPRVEKSITVNFYNSTMEIVDLHFVANIFAKDGDNSEQPH